MKIVICYFSCTGNTKLACEYMVAMLNKHETRLVDMARDAMPDFIEYDLAGFATFADYYGPSKLVESFMERIPGKNKKKHAFVFNTHAGESGKTLMILRDWVASRGFKVVAAHSLGTPENYPPNRACM